MTSDEAICAHPPAWLSPPRLPNTLIEFMVCVWRQSSSTAMVEHNILEVLGAGLDKVLKKKTRTPGRGFRRLGRNRIAREESREDIWFGDDRDKREGGRLCLAQSTKHEGCHSEPKQAEELGDRQGMPCDTAWAERCWPATLGSLEECLYLTYSQGHGQQQGEFQTLGLSYAGARGVSAHLVRPA